MNKASKSTILLCLLLQMCLNGCVETVQSTQPPSDQSRYQAAGIANKAMREMLHTYYAGSHVLEHSWYLPTEHPERAQGLQFLADKFARALLWRDSFIIGTIGSSVTAGHDNCRFDCYQQQLERLFGPVLEQADVEFKVRNTGQGGDCGYSYKNQVWCLPALVGDDVDVTHYSWTYFESGGGDEVIAAHEMFYRWSLMMKHAPVPQLIYTNTCARFTPADKALLERYTPWGADVLCMLKGLAELGYKRGEWGEMGDPLHQTSRAGLLPDTDKARRESLAVMFRNWHPGPLLFQTTADVLAWRYSTALQLALEQLETESHPQQRWPRKTRGLTLAELPQPTHCPQPWCNIESVPVCANFAAPASAIADVKLVGGQAAGWVFNSGRPVSQRAIPEEEQSQPQCAHPYHCSGWQAQAGQKTDWLSFQLPELELGFVAVCCGQKRCGQAMLNAGAEFLLNGRPPIASPTELWDSSCVQMKVQTEQSDSTGKDSESVLLQLRLPARETPLPPITHVFGL